MHLTFADRLRVAYSAPELWFGLVLVVIGAFVVGCSDWLGIYFYLGPVATAPGRVSTAYPTCYSLDELAVRGLTYRYQARGLEWAGTSFTTDSLLQPEMAAPVEFCVSHPAISRLAGTSLNPFGTTGLLTGAVFMLGGAFSMLRCARRARRLLTIATDAGQVQATRHSVRQRSAHSDGSEFELTYSYVVNKRRYQLLIFATGADSHHEREAVCFERANPANAVLASSMPAFIRNRLSAHG